MVLTARSLRGAKAPKNFALAASYTSEITQHLFDRAGRG